MKDANSLFYVDNPERNETVDFDKEGVTVIDGLVFSKTNDGVLRMDCFFDEDTPENRPAVIWIHGGGFTEEHLTRKSRPEERLLKLIKKGYFIASIDYRLSQVEPFPSQIKDCKCAVRFLRANAQKLGINPDRIGVWGESCGGQLAGLMSVIEGIPEFENEGGYSGVSSSISAAVSWYGALDVLEFHNLRMAVDDVYPGRFEVMYGGKPEEKMDILVKSNPMTYVDKKICPLLAMCSDGDDRVSFTVNTEFCIKTKEYGNIAEFVKVPAQGHGYFHGDEYDNMVFNFFDKYI